MYISINYISIIMLVKSSSMTRCLLFTFSFIQLIGSILNDKFTSGDHIFNIFNLFISFDMAVYLLKLRSLNKNVMAIT